MQTADHADRRRRYRVLWSAALVVVVAVAAVVLVRGAGPFGGLAGADERDLPERLSARVVEVLERASLSAEGGYGDPGVQGHPFTDVQGRIVCAARTFGFDPPEAATVAEVRVAYAHHMCAEVASGLDWTRAIRASGPLAVRLSDPVALILPERALPDDPDASYADRIREVVPARYHAAALATDGSLADQVAAALRDRFDRARG